MTQLTDAESAAGNKWKNSQIAVIFFCISCWVSGLLSTAVSPFLEHITVLFQKRQHWQIICSNSAKDQQEIKPWLCAWRESSLSVHWSFFTVLKAGEYKRYFCLRCRKAVRKMELKSGRLDGSWGWAWHAVLINKSNTLTMMISILQKPVAFSMHRIITGLLPLS